MFPNHWKICILKTKYVLGKSPSPNRLEQPPLLFCYINEKLDLEKIVWKLSISATLPNTFDQLCPELFENLAVQA